MPTPDRPPRDNLVRAVMTRAPQLRDGGEGDPMPTLFGHFAVFNRWTKIDSMWEGTFMERIAPGAFTKTFREGKDGMKVLFNHGQDFQIGDKVLGPIARLEEDDEGAYYEVPLFDTSYNRDLAPGLKAGVYGASFRFRVMKEEFVQNPKRSKDNPDGLPERTIKEAQVSEFGPVTFPAYDDATASARSADGSTAPYVVRSLTDAYVLGTLVREPDRLRELLAQAPVARSVDTDALSSGAGAEPHSEEGSRGTANCPDCGGGMSEPREGCSNPMHQGMESKSATPDTPEQRSEPAAPAATPAAPAAAPKKEITPMPGAIKTIDELRARDQEIQARFQEIHGTYGASVLPDEVRSEWESLILERNEGRKAISDYEFRTRQLALMAEDEGRREPVGLDDIRLAGSGAPRRSNARRVPDNVFALEDYRSLSSNMDELRQAYRDGAMKVLERTSLSHPDADEARSKTQVQRLLDQRDSAEGVLAQRMIVTGSPDYQRAFAKSLKGSPLTASEQRALSLGSDPDGGFAVPFQLDPTIILTSDGVVNPLRSMARVEQITGKEWQGVTSDGVTVTRTTEADEATDDSPTLAQPTVRVNRVQGFIPFSVELGQDWGSLQSEMAVLLNDAKDVEESSSFVLGDGTGTNAGGIVGTMPNGSIITTITNDTFAVGDLYKTEENLPPRYRARAQWLANRAIYNKVRQFDTAGGANLWVRLADAQGPELIGYPAKEASAMASAIADAAKIAILGDFRNFLIVDRVGMSVELIPHLFGASGRPTGQRGIYAIWRNNSVILNANGFILLKVQ